jgi:hypothetical protein
MIVVQDSSAALPGVSQYLYVLYSHVIPVIITGRNATYVQCSHRGEWYDIVVQDSSTCTCTR